MLNELNKKKVKKKINNLYLYILYLGERKYQMVDDFRYSVCQKLHCSLKNKILMCVYVCDDNKQYLHAVTSEGAPAK